MPEHSSSPAQGTRFSIRLLDDRAPVSCHPDSWRAGPSAGGSSTAPGQLSSKTCFSPGEHVRPIPADSCLWSRVEASLYVFCEARGLSPGDAQPAPSLTLSGRRIRSVESCHCHHFWHSLHSVNSFESRLQSDEVFVDSFFHHGLG